MMFRRYWLGELLCHEWRWTCDSSGDAQECESVKLDGQPWRYEYEHYQPGDTGTYAAKLLDQTGVDVLASFSALATLAVNTSGSGNLYQELTFNAREFVLPPVWLVIDRSVAAASSGVFRVLTRPIQKW